MSKLGTLTRRTFLVTSAAIAGGVAFGYYHHQKAESNPLLLDLKPGSAALTPYVLVTSEGITLITPHADVGQGAYSIQAYLLAEELDVDPNEITLSPGRPSPAYFNTHVLSEGVPFAATNHGALANGVRRVSTVVAQMLGTQMTGGSSTVPDSYEKLRVAGATAREVLKTAASLETGVPVDQLSTSNQAVVLPNGDRLAYTALAATAATLPLPKEVVLRDPARWRYLGKPIQRTDMASKCSGQAVYGVDLVFDNMLYAAVRINPNKVGGVLRYDASAAEAMRGVHSIIPIKHGVAVLADNTWRAFKAAKAIDCAWEAAPYPDNMEGMWSQVSNAFSSEFEEPTLKNDGDVDQQLSAVNGSDGALITAEYRIPYLAHAPLEPLNATVLYKPDRLDIWTGTQIPRFVQTHGAQLTGLAAEQVHVHQCPMGGSFGARLEDTYVLHTIEIAMTVPGIPVKMTYSREEDMTQDFPRPMQVARGKGVIEGEQVKTFDLQIAGQSVSRSWFGRLAAAPPGPDVSLVAGAWDQPFGIANYRVRGYAVPDMVPVSSWRSVGASGNGFFHEAFLDELLVAAGQDPLAGRIALCNDPVSVAVLEAVKTLSGWDQPLANDRARGVAFTLSFGVPVAQVVEVSTQQGKIKVEGVYVTLDSGRVLDPINFEQQVVGGVLWGLGHAMYAEATYADGMIEQTNFHQYRPLRMQESPPVLMKALENNTHIRGAGEPSVPPIAPALANAIFAATGERVRTLPLSQSVTFEG